MNTPQEFAPLLAGLRRVQARGFADGAALATLLRTQGSTFRRAGARMLVCGDGTVVRGLSGGCPEADIVTRAHGVIARGHAEIVRYDREHGLDALIELGCGGELEVLIEPLRTPADLRFADAVEACFAARRRGLLATVYARDGRCLPQPRRLVWDETIVIDDLAALGEPMLAEQLTERVLLPREQSRPDVERYAVPGGEYEVLFEQLLPPWALNLVGLNAGSLALARIGLQLGWDVALLDHRLDAAPPPDMPAGLRYLRGGPEQVRALLPLDTRSFALVMTHNLLRDIDYLNALADAPLAYLGAIGSRSRADKLRAATGLDHPRLHAPAGLDLGSETPEEIALAIAAEMLAVTARRSGLALSATRGPLHGVSA